MRIGIVGSRKYKNEMRIQRYVAQLPKNTVVISGGAQGDDTIAVTCAKINGLKIVEHLPDFETHGSPAALFIRNGHIVNDSDCIVAFWDGKSTGTLDTIKKAVMAGKVVKIYPDKDNANAID